MERKLADRVFDFIELKNKCERDAKKYQDILTQNEKETVKFKKKYEKNF